MSLSIAAPGTGFAVRLDEHVWLFDRDGRITASLPPPVTAEELATETVKHTTVSSPERCPGCRDFVGGGPHDSKP